MSSKCIILSRVSTLCQDLTQQTDEVKKQAIQDGYRESDIIIIEDKESAVKLDEEHRLGLIELKKTIEEDRRIDCVYAYEISRIGRRAEVNYSIRNFLQGHQVQLVILKPFIKLFDENFKIIETANMTFAIFNALAENEGYIRKERTTRGRNRCKAEGKYIGGTIPYGYYVDENQRFQINREEADIVRYIFNEYTEHGRGSDSIGRELYETGKFKHKTLKTAITNIPHIIRNKNYIGQNRAYAFFPRIISDEQFNKAQAIMDANQCNKKKTESKYKYYCRQLLFEPSGEYTLSPKIGNCSYEISRFLTENNVSINMNLIDSFVWHLTKAYHKNCSIDTVKKVRNDIGRKRHKLQKQWENDETKIQDLNAQLIKIEERIIAGKVREEIGDEMQDRIKAQIKVLENDILTCKNEHAQLYPLYMKYFNAKEYNKSIDDITDEEEIIKLIRRTISKVLVYPTKGRTGHITVKYLDGNDVDYDYHTHNRTFSDMNGNEEKYEYNRRFTKKHYYQDHPEYNHTAYERRKQRLASMKEKEQD